jgi:hypothetical protein
MTTKLRRSVAALATALACLILPASPASASAPGITGGNLVLVSTGAITQNVAWEGTPGPGCGHAFVLANGGTTYEVTQYSSASRLNVFLGGAYIVVVTRTGSTPGVIFGGTTLVGSATLSLKIEFYDPAILNPSTDCGVVAPARCTYTVTLDLSGAVTGWTSSTDTGTLQYGASALAGGIPCAVPFTMWRNGWVAAGGFSFNL